MVAGAFAKFVEDAPDLVFTARSLGGVRMVRFNPKSFAQPDLLKTIQPQNLVRLLEPCRGFLETHGLSLPQEEGLEIDYLKLAGVLAIPDEWMDSHVVEGLHVIGNLGNDENFDELLDIARRNFIEEATAADVAARIWTAVLGSTRTSWIWAAPLPSARRSTRPRRWMHSLGFFDEARMRAWVHGDRGAFPIRLAGFHGGNRAARLHRR
jgi:hypothetical protein